MAEATTPDITELDINATIHEVLSLISSELHEHHIYARIRLLSHKQCFRSWAIRLLPVAAGHREFAHERR